ncbi:hypothetical protein QZH41_010621 [Actinostola sp. cb2023]|nr:hypothetical protein QZH41_010621 [Actinostola sp. cb2023]
MADGTLTFEGCNFFRLRLVLATLSSRSVRIKNIRTHDDNPGLKDFEASFIRLLDKLTNGSHIEVNETGTSIYYKPGLLAGGTIDHECNIQRAIGYYLEAVVMLAPFCKKPLKVTMRGVTNDEFDPSVDVIKTVTIPLMKRYIIDDEGFDIKISKRGSPPEGGGQIYFTCPVRKTLSPLQFTDPGKIKRIRGLAYATRVSPAMGGCVDSRHQSIALLFMAMGQADVSRVLTGPLTPYTIQFLRHLKNFTGVMFKIQTQDKDPEDDSKTGGQTKVLLSCVGMGFTNVNKGII